MGKSTFFKDFRAFIMRGNIIDMAVGVIIGGAFSKIVSSLVADIITPLISLALGKTDFSDIVWTLRAATDDSEAIVMNGGAFIQTVIDFLIIALCIFVALRIAVKARHKAEALLHREKEMEAEAALLMLGNALQLNRAAEAVKSELQEATKDRNTWKTETDRILEETMEVTIHTVDVRKMGCRVKPAEMHKVLFLF